MVLWTILWFTGVVIIPIFVFIIESFLVSLLILIVPDSLYYIILIIASTVSAVT